MTHLTEIPKVRGIILYIRSFHELEMDTGIITGWFRACIRTLRPDGLNLFVTPSLA